MECQTLFFFGLFHFRPFLLVLKEKQIRFLFFCGSPIRQRGFPISELTQRQNVLTKRFPLDFHRHSFKKDILVSGWYKCWKSFTLYPVYCSTSTSRYYFYFIFYYLLSNADGGGGNHDCFFIYFWSFQTLQFLANVKNIHVVSGSRIQTQDHLNQWKIL